MTLAKDLLDTTRKQAQQVFVEIRDILEKYLSQISAATVSILDAYPIGAIYISVVSTNPGSLFGGTWAAFGAGRVLVGLNGADTDFDTSEETGGGKTHTHSVTSNVTIGSEAAHTHSVTSNVTVDDHIGAQSEPVVGISDSQIFSDSGQLSHNVTNNEVTSGTGSAHTHTPTNNAVTSGNNSAIAMPYIVVYMFKRTA